MTPGARVQAAIEILDQIIAAARDGGAAADTLIARYFAGRRYAGSKDRRAVREIVYDVVRTIGEVPVSGRAALIGYARTSAPALLDSFGSPGHAPAPLVPHDAEAMAGLAPSWLVERLERRFGAATDAHLAALLGRAPLDLRVNTLKATRADVLAEVDGVKPMRFAADGLRADGPLAVDTLPAFNAGRIEVQDEGSQITAAASGAAAGMTVVDLCAGAGGKTLALAAMMDNRGRIVATDTDRGRLDRMGPRLDRAGVTIVERRLLDPGHEAEALADLAGTADLVLVDAPCSGTGTWRRNPEARWRLTPARLDRLVREQARLLDVAAALVRPGGTLAYVVCSLLPEEGEAQIAAFLRRSAGWRAAPFVDPIDGASREQLVLTPFVHGCDGFFVAHATTV